MRVGEIVLDGGVASPAAIEKTNSVGLGPWGCVVRTATLVRGYSTAGSFLCTDRMVAALAAGTSCLISQMERTVWTRIFSCIPESW